MRQLLLALLALVGPAADPALADTAPTPVACRFTLEAGPDVVDEDGRVAATWIVTCRPPAPRPAAPGRPG